jgi:hypothetical protein
MKENNMNKILLIILISAGAIQQISAQPAPRPLPAEIYFVAEKAEDVIDFYLQNNWVAAQALVDSISATPDTLESYFRENRMPRMVPDLYDYLLFQLSLLTVEQKDPLQAALVANQITRMMIELEGNYVHSAPMQVPLMDYLGRELVILAKMPDDYGLPQIMLRNGQALATKVDQTIARIKAASNRQEIEQEGNVILDLVDEIENLFK